MLSDARALAWKTGSVVVDRRDQVLTNGVWSPLISRSAGGCAAPEEKLEKIQVDLPPSLVGAEELLGKSATCSLFRYELAWGARACGPVRCGVTPRAKV